MPGFDNSPLVQNLKSHFQARYEPNFAWVNALSAFTLLEGLRGLWTFGSVDENLLVYDHAHQGRNLTDVNTVGYDTYNLMPYSYYNGTDEYLRRADEAGLDITAGITIGGWFWFESAQPASDEACLGKWETTLDKSYIVQHDSTGVAQFIVTTDGTTEVAVSSAAALATETWYFLCGRYVPSTEMSIWVNDLEAVRVAGIPASIWNSAADFTIGAYDNPSNYLTGYAALCFLCAAALDDVVIKSLYWQTKAVFNVS